MESWCKKSPSATLGSHELLTFSWHYIYSCSCHAITVKKNSICPNITPLTNTDFRIWVKESQAVNENLFHPNADTATPSLLLGKNS